MRARRSAVWGWALGLLLGWGLAAGCTNAPTLPVPPPNALVEEPPDAEGFVTIRVSGAEPDALVLGLNERTGNGTIETAGPTGEASLRLRAEIGDAIQVWQRVGSQGGEVVDVIVPGPRDAGSPDAGPPPDGG